MTIQTLKTKIFPTLKRQGVVKAGVFGSFVRGEIKKDSDTDLLIKLKKEKTLLDFVGLKLELEDKLGKKVDLVEYSAIHPFIKNRVLKEQIPIL